MPYSPILDGRSPTPSEIALAKIVAMNDERKKNGTGLVREQNNLVWGVYYKSQTSNPTAQPVGTDSRLPFPSLSINANQGYNPTAGASTIFKSSLPLGDSKARVKGHMIFQGISAFLVGELGALTDAIMGDYRYGGGQFQFYRNNQKDGLGILAAHVPNQFGIRGFPMAAVATTDRQHAVGIGAVDEALTFTKPWAFAADEDWALFFESIPASVATFLNADLTAVAGGYRGFGVMFHGVEFIRVGG